MHEWLRLTAWTSIALGIILALLIARHEIGRPQRMWIMNLVWPITALYSSVLGLWG